MILEIYRFKNLLFYCTNIHKSEKNYSNLIINSDSQKVKYMMHKTAIKGTLTSAKGCLNNFQNEEQQ